MGIEQLTRRLFWALAVFCLAATASSGVIWYLLGPEPRLLFSGKVMAAVAIASLSVLFILATHPLLSLALGLSRAHGGDFKTSAELAKAASVDYLVFESAALELGVPEFADIVPNPFSAVSEKLLLQIAASLEQAAENDGPSALVMSAKRKGLSLLAAADVFHQPGLGAQAIIGGQKITFGSLGLMQSEAVDVSALREKAGQLAQAGKRVRYLVIEGEFAGLLALEPKLQPKAETVIKRLHELRVSVALLTSDERETARALAEKLGIERVMARVLPEDRAVELKKLEAAGRSVAYVTHLRPGPGLLAEALNSGSSAEALAKADVSASGLAMAFGNSDFSDKSLKIESLEGVFAALHIARQSLRVVRGNLFFIFAYSVIAVPLAAGLLYPFFGWLLSPFAAAAAVALSSLFVVMNSLRLKNVGI